MACPGWVRTQAFKQHTSSQIPRRNGPASKLATNWSPSTGFLLQRAADVTKRLWALGIWSQARYALERQGQAFVALVVVAPAAKPLAFENYLRVVGLVYLFVGLFIFARRWTATRAVHFYVFCLASSVLFSFHYTGKLNQFDWEIYWSKVVATLLAPALLVHFALFFPERGNGTTSLAPPWGCRNISTSGRAAGDPYKRRHRTAGICSLAASAHQARSARARLSGSVLPAGRGDFPDQLRTRAERTTAPAVEMGGRRHSGRLRAVRAGVHPAVRARRGATAVDESVGGVAGAAAALLCLCDRSLPPDGRRHHLQARAWPTRRRRRAYWPSMPRWSR